MEDKITIDGIQTDKKTILQALLFYHDYHSDEVFEKDEENEEYEYRIHQTKQPFDMYRWLKDIKRGVHYMKDALLPGTELRLDALIKVWEWKKSNDSHHGNFFVCFTERNNELGYRVDIKKKMGALVDIGFELPGFTSKQKAEESVKNLIEEYKIVFDMV